MVANGRNGTSIALKPFVIIQARIISSLMGFLGLYFILHYYNRETYGTLTFTLSLLAGFNAFADLGFRDAHIRHLSRGEDEGRCTGTYLVIKLGLAGIMAAMVLTFLGIYTLVLGQSFHDTSVGLILLFTLYYLLQDMVSVAVATFNARRETAKSQLTFLIDPFVRVPLVILLALLGASANILYVAYVVGMAAVAVVGFLLLSRHPIGRPSRALFRSYLAFAFPLFLVTPANVFANNIDKVLLGIFWTSRDVGAYGAVEGLVTSLAVLYVAINTLSFPLFSKLDAQGQGKEIRRVVHRAERYLMAVLLPIVLVALVYPREVLGFVLGPELQVHAPLLRIYFVAFAIYCLGMVYYPILPAAGRTDLLRLLAVLYAVIFGTLCLLLIPRGFLGLPTPGLRNQGAAWALVAANLFNTLSIRIMAWRVSGVPANPRVLLHGAAGAVSGAFLLAWSRWVGVPSLLGLLEVGLLGLLLHLGVLYLLRELTREDFREAWDAVNPGVVAGYIAAELRSHR